MTLKEVIKNLNLEIYSQDLPQSALDKEVTGATCGDMLSHIIASAQEGHLWLTIQKHQNIVAVASLTGLTGIILTGGITPDKLTISRAKEEEIAILGTKEKTYETACRLGKLNI